MAPTTTKAALPAAPQKPVLKVGQDGFPSGHATPEGAAVDLASAFILKSPVRFRDVCIPPFGAGEGRQAYEQFLTNVEASMKVEAAKSSPSPGGPKTVLKLFAARHLSKEGPASFGYAAFNFRDVMFVDVEVLLQGGPRLLNRTLVIQDSDGKWYVHPAPDTCPLLCDGLNEESKSEMDFTQAYEIQKP